MNYDGPAIADALARARHRIERDEALLRQCLQEFQSFESGTGGLYQGEFAEIITALRERLGEKT